MGKSKGLCCVCGKGGKLTFEHVPPKAAYNDTDTEMFGIDDWLKRDDAGEMAGGHPQPQGSGFITICKKCNEYSGSWYVPDFAKLVRAGALIHHQLEDRLGDDADDSLDAKVVGLTIGQARPLPVLKEMVAMLLAINGPEFGRKHQDLVKFVLDKGARGLPDRYRIFLTLFRGPLARFVGLACELHVETGTQTWLTEIAYLRHSSLR